MTEALSNEYYAAHHWLHYNWEKTGRCENCQKEGQTDWAFLRHPAEHTRIREDYRELCRACHLRSDYGWTDTHCPRGHDLIHVYVRPDGKRYCRRCKREREGGR